MDVQRMFMDPTSPTSPAASSRSVLTGVFLSPGTVAPPEKLLTAHYVGSLLHCLYQREFNTPLNLDLSELLLINKMQHLWTQGKVGLFVVGRNYTLEDPCTPSVFNSTTERLIHHHGGPSKVYMIHGIPVDWHPTYSLGTAALCVDVSIGNCSDCLSLVYCGPQRPCLAGRDLYYRSKSKFVKIDSMGALRPCSDSNDLYIKGCPDDTMIKLESPVMDEPQKGFTEAHTFFPICRTPVETSFIISSICNIYQCSLVVVEGDMDMSNDVLNLISVFSRPTEANNEPFISAYVNYRE